MKHTIKYFEEIENNYLINPKVVKKIGLGNFCWVLIHVKICYFNEENNWAERNIFVDLRY